MPSIINVDPGNAINLTALYKIGASDANLIFRTSNTNAIVIDNTQTANFVSSGAVTIPRGTTAQRPSPARNGMFRYNTSNNAFEVYISGSWTFL